ADVDGDGRADAIVVNDETIPYGRVVVRRSNGSSFLPNEEWTQEPYYGNRGTFFADVDGDGRADAIVVNDETIPYGRAVVRRSNGSSFLPNEEWTQKPYYGSRGAFVADVDGARRADAIVLNDARLIFRRSNGSSFLPNEEWTQEPYYGSRGTFFADVDGDGRADAIVVNDDGITVRRSNGSSFVANEAWTQEAYFGSRGTFFADLDGGRKADA